MKNKTCMNLINAVTSLLSISFSLRPKGGSRTATTSKMEHFLIIVNGWKPIGLSQLD